jgi:hypothetical protein
LVEQIAASNSWAEFEAAMSQLGKTEKGYAFEELTRLHLLTDPYSFSGAGGVE